MQNQKTALGLDLNVGALVCYLNICLPIGLIYSIIVLVTDKTNKLPRFHAMQSLLLTAGVFVVGIVLGIAVGVFTAVTESAFLGLGFNSLFGLVVLGLWIFMAVKAYGGEMFKLPVIGDMADKWSN